MSQDELPGALKEIFQHSWIITFLAATWGVVLRALVGRYQNQAAEQRETLHKIRNTLHSMEGRLAFIEGRLAERDHLTVDTGEHQIE